MLRLIFPIIGGAVAGLIKNILLRDKKGALDQILALTTDIGNRLLAIVRIQDV